MAPIGTLFIENVPWCNITFSWNKFNFISLDFDTNKDNLITDLDLKFAYF